MSRGKIIGLVNELLRNYPGSTASQQVIQTYVNSLSKAEKLEWVERAMAEAPRDYPDRCPTTGQLWSLVNKYRNQERAMQEAHAIAEGRRRAMEKTPPRNEAVWEKCRAFALEAENHFERLARYWEGDSVSRGIKPEDTIPKELAEQRMKQLQEVIAKHWT